MKVASKRCLNCRRRFQPDPRAARQQRACAREPCRRARRRLKLRSWRKRHPGSAAPSPAKVRAWAAAYPDYWRQWRAKHPGYREREKRRLRAKRRRGRRVANVTGMAEIAVEKLRGLAAAGPQGVAKETGLSRRVDGVVEFLIWKEGVAKQTDMEPAGGPVG